MGDQNNAPWPFRRFDDEVIGGGGGFPSPRRRLPKRYSGLVSTHWKAHSRRSSSLVWAPALHSQQTAMTSLGILDPEREMAQMQKENAGAVR